MFPSVTMMRVAGQDVAARHQSGSLLDRHGFAIMSEVEQREVDRRMGELARSWTRRLYRVRRALRRWWVTASVRRGTPARRTAPNPAGGTRCVVGAGPSQRTRVG
ncbi:hypothetical protein GCM10010399_62110 [Dactylosporangium fulvum]